MASAPHLRAMSMSLSARRYDSREGAGPSKYASSAYRTCNALRSASEYTATVSIPSSRQARMMRTAISPRLATRTFLNMTPHRRERQLPFPTTHLQRNIPVLLRRVTIAFVAQHFQAVDQARTRLLRLDHIVDVAA